MQNKRKTALYPALTFQVHIAGKFCNCSLLAYWARQLIGLIGDLSDEVLGDTVEELADNVTL